MSKGPKKKKVAHTPKANNDWLYGQMHAQTYAADTDIAQAERSTRRLRVRPGRRRMTVIAFLDRLARTPLKWKRTESGAIVDRYGMCPHFALDSYIEEPFKGPGAVPTITLCNAARNVPGHDPKIRTALLQACGLSPDPPEAPQEGA